MAFVLEHPGGDLGDHRPRTMEQLTDVLDGAGTRLSDEVLDRIDEIVPPGTNVNVADTGWEAASPAALPAPTPASDRGQK